MKISLSCLGRCNKVSLARDSVDHGSCLVVLSIAPIRDKVKGGLLEIVTVATNGSSERDASTRGGDPETRCSYNSNATNLMLSVLFCVR